MNNESSVQQYIQLTAPEEQTILMRNNSGALKDLTGRIVRYGLGNVSKKQNDTIKSSDLIGIRTITITQEMVGKQVGVFTAIEVKSSDWKMGKKPTAREKAQQNFLDWVFMRGGMAGFCKSVNDFKNLSHEYMNGLIK